MLLTAYFPFSPSPPSLHPSLTLHPRHSARPHPLIHSPRRRRECPRCCCMLEQTTSPFCRTNNTRRVDPVLSCKACDMMIHRSFFKSTNLVSLLVTSRLHFDQSTSNDSFSTSVRMIATSNVFLYVMLYLVFVLNNFFVRKIKGQGFE